jgi:penicillin-binding protein 1A
VVWQAEEPKQEQVIDAGIAYLITDALREALVRGTGQAVSQSGFKSPAAGKTGTTNDGADAWFVGYTPDVVAAVWVGFDKRRPIVAKATGGRVAAPVWARMMLRMYQKRAKPAEWTRPSGVIEGMVDPASGMLLASGCRPFGGTAYREVFVQGTAPQTVCPSQGQPTTLAPWELPPLPGLDEGVETGVPLDEVALDDEGYAAEMEPPSPMGETLPPPGDVSGSPAPPLSYAPSSPRPPSASPDRPMLEPTEAPLARPTPLPRPSPRATPADAPEEEEDEDDEREPVPSPTPPSADTLARP